MKKIKEWFRSKDLKFRSFKQFLLFIRCWWQLSPWFKYMNREDEIVTYYYKTDPIRVFRDVAWIMLIVILLLLIL